MSAVIGLSVLLLGFSGCSGSVPSPADPASAHPGTAPPGTSVATPSQDPGQAAIAAVQRMYAEYNRMLKSGSSVAYRRTFTSDCSICSANADTTDRIAAKHEQVVGGQLTLSRLRIVTDEGALVIVEGSLNSPAAEIVKGGSTLKRFLGGGIHQYTWRLLMTDGQLLVSSVTTL
jgi:hypothetical protein